MERLIFDLLSRQDPTKSHTWLTRCVITFVILFGYTVLYGVYGVIGSVVGYLVLVELMGFSLRWMFLPFALSILIGLWKCVPQLEDYWRRYW